MSDAARKVLSDALALSDDERAELASELIASLDGPADRDLENAWLAEIDRRVAAALERGEPGDDWTAVRARLLGELGR